MNLLVLDDEAAVPEPRLTPAARTHAAPPAALAERGPGRPLFLVGEREHRLYPLEPLAIDYVESAGNYVTYHLAGVEYICRESIKRLVAVLAPVGFVRIERSLLHNVRAIAYAQSLGHASCGVALLVLYQRLVDDQVQLPGLAAVGRERLLEAAGVWRED